MIRAATVADAPGIARVLVDTWRATYRGIVPDEFLDHQLSYAASEARFQGRLADRSQILYVAVAESGEVVGLASGGPERTGDPVYTGEVYALYILPEHQSKGLGRKLVAAVAHDLAQAGHRSLLIRVLAENPSRRFYEAIGGEFLNTHQVEIGGAQLAEAAYGWREISQVE